MQDIDLTSTQSLIDRYYQEEQAKREKEQALAALTVRMDANDLSMLSIIAKRFQKNRDEIAQEVLSNALVDIFSRLDASERKLLARDADDSAKAIAHEIAEENGVHSIEFKAGVWAGHDRNITKLERKKAKQAAESQAIAEQQPVEQAEMPTEAETPATESATADASNDSSEGENDSKTATTSMFAG